MKLINTISFFVFLWASTAQSEIDVTKIIQAPREFSVGMTESKLASQKEGLFPGPSVSLEGSNVSFKTFMEIDGMGSPGHRSFYYLFEDDKLQGVIQTTSLLGLDEDEAVRIASFNYKRVLEAVSGRSEASEILRKDGDSFSKVTLERWSIDNETMNVFHVATNYESSVGVLSSDTRFPTAQLFVPAEDQRFQGQIKDEATIADISRVVLQKVAGLQIDDRQRERRDLAPSNPQYKADHHELDQDKNSASNTQGSDEYVPPHLIWMLMAFVFFGVVYVFWKIRNNRK